MRGTKERSMEILEERAALRLARWLIIKARRNIVRILTSKKRTYERFVEPLGEEYDGWSGWCVEIDFLEKMCADMDSLRDVLEAYMELKGCQEPKRVHEAEYTQADTCGRGER